jgi:hypothetical protein
MGSFTVGIHEILGWPGETFEGGAELGPVFRAIDAGENELEDSGLGSGPAEGELAVGFIDQDSAMTSDGDQRFQFGAAANQDYFPVLAEAMGLPLEDEEAGGRIDTLDIEILHVEMEIGHAPSDVLVVADDDGRSARDRHAGDVHGWGADVDLIPDAGEGKTQMGIIRQNRFA